MIMWILRLDMSDRTHRVEDVPEAYRLLGGRGLTSTIISDEVPPGCHPLGPNNKLVFAPGIVTGTPAPTSARVSVGGKSPLTGTIKESNAGSGWAPALAAMRIKALVVEGKPEEKGKYWIVRIAWNGEAPQVEFLPADEYVGKDLYEVFPQLFERFGRRAQIAGTGVAGKPATGSGGSRTGVTRDSIDPCIINACLKAVPRGGPGFALVHW